SARLSGLAGPATFSVVTQVAGSSRWGVLATAVFFLMGGGLLLAVQEPALQVTAGGESVRATKESLAHGHENGRAETPSEKPNAQHDRF
ncbi:MAG: hypothetical protein ACK42L_08265, partial [Thermoanaerobaculum sp.]